MPSQRARLIKSEVYALYLAYKDPRTSWYARLFVAFVVGYAISPIDLIPDAIPILGYLDDLVLVPLGIWLALKMIPPEVMAESRARAQELAAQGKLVSRSAATVIVVIWVWLATLSAALLARYGFGVTLPAKNWLLAGAGLALLVILISLLLGRTAQTGPKIRWGRPAVFAFITLLVILAGISNWLARDRALAMIYPTHLPVRRTPETVGVQNYQNISFQTPDGLTLRGWYIPTQNGAAVIVIHGHGGNRGSQLEDIGLLASHGYGVLAYDARNCGESDGSITTFGLTEVNDVRGAWDFLLTQPGVDPSRIGLLGHSMGGATALLAAEQIPAVRAVVAESTYASLEDDVRQHLRNLLGLPPFPFAPLVIFWGELETGIEISQVRPIDAIAALSPRPVLIVHGELDELMPVENAHRLYQAAGEPKDLLILPQAGHCCLLEAGKETYTQRVIGFFDRYLLGKPTSICPSTTRVG